MDSIDQVARDDANHANGRIDSHETLCTERWTQQRQAMVLVQTTVDEIKKRMDKTIGHVPASIIAVMASIIGYLAARAFPIPHP